MVLHAVSLTRHPERSVAKSKFCVARNERSKTEEQRDEGISKRFLHSFVPNVTSLWKEAQNSNEIPLRAFARSHTLDPQKFDYGLRPSLRMTYRGMVPVTASGGRGKPLPYGGNRTFLTS